MKYDAVVCHYHEIGLKGRNRDQFERRLIHNIREAIAATGYRKVQRLPGRVVVRLDESSDLAAILNRLGLVFGLSHFSPALETPSDMEALVEAGLQLAREADFESFQVRARKGHTTFPEGSQRVNEVVGQALKDATGKRVDLTQAQWTCHIELVLDTAFVYSNRHEGPGGLPVGASGKVVALLSGGIDSPVAAWEVAKRGARIELVHFHGQPFTDPSSVRQATRLAEQLSPWLAGARLWLIPFGEIQSEIVTSTPEELRVVLYRRFMMRIAEALALQEGAEGLVTGESLGQVASQTLANIRAIDAVVESIPVLRPLVGRDKIEIERLAKRIGTYEISIDPYQDCCVLFVPRQVTTRASLGALEEAESTLDVGGLAGKGLANAEQVTIVSST